VIRRILLGLFALLVVLVAGLAVFVALRQNLRFNAPYPPVEASTDSVVVERGRYIVRDLAVCAGCHGDPTQTAAFLRGEDIPLSGGNVFDIPPGKFYVPNITSDPQTGLGKASDAAIARALRYNVGHDGRALLPFMNKQGMADDDLVAVVSYLRSQPPISHMVPAHQYTLLGKVVKATVLANPVGPKSPPPPTAPRGASVENGRYLAEVMADCGSCHTQRDMRTGALIGPPLGGATGFQGDSTGSWSPPNITKGGRLATLDEDAFVARMRAGRAIPHSPMPWQFFQKLDEQDLRAIYRYLVSLPPSTQDVGPPFVKKEPKTKR
jgi:mono/diheme cytochrome c family protein